MNIQWQINLPKSNGGSAVQILSRARASLLPAKHEREKRDADLLRQLDEIRQAQGLSRRARSAILDLRERLIELVAFWALWFKHHHTASACCASLPWILALAGYCPSQWYSAIEALPGRCSLNLNSDARDCC
jgi:hypothetical protein